MLLSLLKTNFSDLFWLHWVSLPAGGLSLVAGSGGYSLVGVHGLIIVVTSLVSEQGLRRQGPPAAFLGSIVVVYRLSCSEAHGIFSVRD